MSRWKLRIRVILSLLVSGIFFGGNAYPIYSGTDAWVSVLGWRAPLFFACALAAMAIMAIARASGIDLGEARASISVGDVGEDWDD